MELNNEKKKSFWLGALVGVLITGLVLTSVFSVFISMRSIEYTKKIKEASNTSSNLSSNKIVTATFANKIERIYKDIQNEFLFTDNIDEDKMRESMYNGFLASLDDKYTYYYDEDTMADLGADYDGIYYGVGSYVMIDEDTSLPKFSGVFKGSPAMEAGIKDGDLLYAINGVEQVGVKLNDAVKLIKGPEGTTVDLTILRGNEKLEITVTRGKVSVPTVTYRMIDNVGYIFIQEFDTVTISQFNEAYKEVMKNNPIGLILDLRSNPGGSVQAVVEVAKNIIGDGEIVTIKYKNGYVDKQVCKGGKRIDIPLTVLVNEYSASASELLTGAIRDNGCGTIIGTNTFGKGIVQNVFDLNDGTGYQMTTAYYYTPSGECIHKVGIAPDIEVKPDPDKEYDDPEMDNQIEYAIKYIEDQAKNGK